MTDLLFNGGRKIILNRAFKSTPDYTTVSRVRFGTNSATYSVTSTDLTNPIPILDGTVLDDGSNTLTGGTAGNNSTDNTSVYKPGASQTDNTAQNLIKDNTNVSATWSISDLSSAGTNATADQYTGIWIYVLNSTALSKFKSSGTALEIKIGSDSSNYYSITYEAADLSTGWNWLPFGVLNTLTETGTVGSPIDYFEIDIETNNATDEFTTNEVVYDLLRQWEESDTFMDLSVGYPNINEIDLNVVFNVLLGSDYAVGFVIDSVAFYNTDGTYICYGADTFEESKADTDEFEIERTDG